MISERDAESIDDSEQEPEQRPGFIYAVMGQGLFSVSRLMTSVVIGGRFSQGLQGTGSQAELGIYLAYFSVLLLSVSVLEAFVTVPMTYLMHTRHGLARKQFSSFLLMACAAMAGAAGVLVIGVGCLLQNFQADISIGTLSAFGLLVTTQFLREFLARWVLARLESKRYAFIEALYLMIYVPILAGLLFTESLSIANLFAALTFANLVIVGVWWSIYQNEFVNLFSDRHPSGQPIEFKEQHETVWVRFLPMLKEQVFYGRWIGADSVSCLATVYFCNWYLLLKVGAAGAGVYGACMTVVLLVNPFLNGVMAVFAPITAVQFERGGKPALTAVMFKFGIPLTIMVALFSFSLYFTGGWLTEKFFGDRYNVFFQENYGGVNRITFLIGLSMPLTTIAYVLACGVMACGKPMYTFFSSAIGLVTMMVLCLFLQEPDLEQCAICFSISTALVVATRWFFYRRNVGQQPAAPITAQ